MEKLQKKTFWETQIPPVYKQEIVSQLPIEEIKSRLSAITGNRNDREKTLKNFVGRNEGDSFKLSPRGKGWGAAVTWLDVRDEGDKRVLELTTATEISAPIFVLAVFLPFVFLYEKNFVIAATFLILILYHWQTTLTLKSNAEHVRTQINKALQSEAGLNAIKTSQKDDYKSAEQWAPIIIFFLFIGLAWMAFEVWRSFR